jgi:hypothetical protein
VSVGNVRDIDRATRSNLSSDILAGLGKGWRREATLTCRSGMEVCPVLRVDTVVHLCRVLKAWSLSGRNYSVVPTFYTHCSVVDGL